MKTLQDKSLTQGRFRLDIIQDDCCDSPRNDDNIGLFLTAERNKCSPDEHTEYQQIILSTSDDANDMNEHIELIKESIPEIKYIYPVSKYEHSGVKYSLGVQQGFDSCLVGYYIVTNDEGMTEDNIIDRIKYEIDRYSTWVNGETYGFIFYRVVPLFYEDGKPSNTTEEMELDSAWGFYDAEDLKDNLTDEAKALFDAM